MHIGKILERQSLSSSSFQPEIFHLAVLKDQKRLSKLLANRTIQHVVDDYKEQLQELFAVRNPTLVYTPSFKDRFEEYYNKSVAKQAAHEQGRWVFYPWMSMLVHILDDKEFQLVRTSRNRNLITTEEQDKFYNAVIGIAGLSVGNSVTLAIVLQGGGRHFRLADFDRLALSNINRIRAGVDTLGLKKVEMTARQIYLLNPYARVELFPDGLTSKNIERFFSGPPPLDVVIDELDTLAVKYLIRQKAKKHRLAVVMGADNGDNAVIDIERYDLNKSTTFFHGRIGKMTYQELLNLDKFGIGRTITKHIGPENVTARMQDSLLAMGKTIVSWPQLGGAALLNGSAVAYCVRKILNGQPLESNRAIVSLDEKLFPGYNSAAARKRRLKLTENFKKIMHLD